MSSPGTVSGTEDWEVGALHASPVRLFPGLIPSADAPGTAAAEMVEAIVRDQKRVLPCTIMLDGEYGYKNICVGVPVLLGKGGCEKIFELKLNADEQAHFDKSAKHVEETIKQAKELLGL
jgi:malate dehydrogenase